MIRYSLVCGGSHGFEAWFRDSAGFDDLARDGHITCPLCGSSEVRKAMMAPAIRRGAQSAVPDSEPRKASAPVAEDSSVPVAMEAPPQIEDGKARQMRALLRELHAKVKASAENVGAAFPREARKIHDGDEAPRSIYGTATAEEVRSLVEDGVGIMPLPPLPEDRN